MANIKTAVTAAIMMLMFLASPNATRAWAGDDGKASDDKAADATKKDLDVAKKDADKAAASTEVAKSASTPSSAFESELQQLREELGAQQALLQSQQARIAQLENQLHVGQGQPVAWPPVRLRNLFRDPFQRHRSRRPRALLNLSV